MEHFLYMSHPGDGWVNGGGMVLKQDGSSEHVAHVWSKTGLFREKKIEFDYSFDATKCLQQIKYLIYSICAHSEMSNQII